MDTKNKAAWRGSIQFGMATMPVGLFTAVRPHAVHLASVHRGCGGRVKLRKVCETHGAELSSAEIQRAAESGAPIEDGALPSVADDAKRVMEVAGFAPAASIDPLAYGKPYHVAPEPSGRKAYALLRAAMAKTRTVAMVTVVFSGAPSLAMLAADGDGLTLRLLCWSDELVSAPDRGAPVRVTPKELTAARALIDAMPVDPATLRDEHTDAMLRALADLPEPAPAASVSADGPLDLMAALTASVKASKR